VLLGSARVKASHKMLVKSTPVFRDCESGYLIKYLITGLSKQMSKDLLPEKKIQNGKKEKDGMPRQKVRKTPNDCV